MEKSQEVKKLVKPESIYENEEFYRQTEAATATGQQQTFPRKTGSVSVEGEKKVWNCRQCVQSLKFKETKKQMMLMKKQFSTKFTLVAGT